MFKNLQIEYVDPASLRPNPFNPNVVDPINQDKIRKSLRERGFWKPLIVHTLPDGTLEILGGQHRWRAALEEGFGQVPIQNLGAIPDHIAKQICVQDNGPYGHNDPQKMQDLLNSNMGTAEELLALLPMDEEELASFFDHDTSLEQFNDELDRLDALDDETIDLTPTKSSKTHQILRFKVPINDVDRVQERIERVMRDQGLVGGDSLTNAGDALIHILFMEYDGDE